MKKIFLLLTLTIGGLVHAQSSLNISLLGSTSYMFENSDIWGYTDSLGLEYALVGTNAGVSIVDVSLPTQPQKKQFIQGPYSTWRDLKTWSHFAYVTHDSPFAWNMIPDQGLLIIDMDSVNESNARYKAMNFAIPDTMGGFDTLKTVHNLYIDEKGYCYLFGSNIGIGGALIFDLNNDPWNPTYVGIWDTYYLHDGMVRGDTLWGAAINEGEYVVVDVAKKDSAYLMASKATPNSFTHNTWISDDNQTLFTTDEVGGAFLTAYDVSNLANMTELDRIQSLPGTMVIPHNAHVYGDWVVTSYYTSGVQIVDAKYPELLVEVGFYDTSPNFTGNGFNGNWGTYPYFESQRIICSDIEEGLYVLNPTYVNASRVHVQVVDSITGAPLSNAIITMKDAGLQESSSIDGFADLGTPNKGIDSLYVTLSGFVAAEFEYNWIPGAFDTVRVALLNVNNIGFDNSQSTAISIFPNPSKGRVQLSGITTGSYALTDLTGRILETGSIHEENLHISSQFSPGQYLLKVSSGDLHKVFPLSLQH